MNGVIGMTDLLIDTGLTPDQGEYAQTIRSSGESLMTIINDILDFSKIESGHLQLEQRSFNLRTCVEEVMDLFSIKATDRDLDLVYWFSPRVPDFVVGDETRLRQILLNLLSNALKFTHRGEVCVQIDTGETPIEGEMFPLEVSVRDTGIGIPPEKVSNLFQAFTQLDVSTTRKYGGTGLGLAISRKLCHMMGGEISVESAVGEGSTFSFFIQVKAEARTSFIVRDVPDAEILKGKQVLAVDDNPVNLRLLKDLLTARGVHVKPFSNADQALDYVKTNPVIDLVLTDMRMPGMSGLEFAQVLRSLQADLPVILLSSATEWDANDTRRKWFAGITNKPIKARVLIRMMSRALQATPTVASLPPITSSHVLLARKHPLRILVAEDNEVNQTLIMLLLRRMGYDPQLVESGADAVEHWQTQRHDLIFMDVQMPIMDGITATQEIRATHGDQPIIVAMTAAAMQGDRERCLEAGMNDYISKPFRREQIEATIQRCAVALKG